MDHISIILIHYNAEEETTDCLKSLVNLKADGFKYSVIVVDNGSKVPYEIPAVFAKQPFELVRSESNLGYTGGNNLAITHAFDEYHSDYVLLLNNDTTVDREFAQELWRAAQTQPQHGLIASKIYFSPGREYHGNSYTAKDRGNVLWYAGGSIDWQNLIAFHRGVDELDRGHFDTQQESDFATGCSVLIKREVLEKIGLLEEKYFLYLEDVDLSVRAAQAGYGIGFCPTSKVWHKNAGSSGGAGSPLHQYYQTRNRLLFAMRYGSWRTRLTAASLAVRLGLGGNQAERAAVKDLVTGQLGKRVVV